MSRNSTHGIPGVKVTDPSPPLSIRGRPESAVSFMESLLAPLLVHWGHGPRPRTRWRASVLECGGSAPLSTQLSPKKRGRTGALQSLPQAARSMERGVVHPLLLSVRCLLLFVAFAALGICFSSSNVQAAEKTVRINLGTLAPRGSLYYQSLQAMAEAWRQAPGGGVRLVIYPDGTQGSEADMVRLMRVGSLQAGLLTAVGLSDIEPAVGGLQDIPMLFRSLEEFERVTDQLRPTLEKRLAEKGFVVLFWVDAGWVRYFSKEPVLTPDDLRRMKIFVWSGSPDQVSIMRHAGFTPVPLETSDILPGLQTGLITAAPLPPIFALAAQVDLRAPHMLNINWAPLVGACVVKKDSWDKIPDNLREPLLAAATRAGKEIRANSHKESDNAVAAMQKRGLKVHDPSPEVIQQWRNEAEKSWPDIRGRIVPAEIFDQVQEKLREYRASRN